jgi:predicted outer membrane protein
MQNQLVYCIAIAMAGGLAGCGDDGTSNDSNSSGPENMALDQGDQRGQALTNLAQGEFQGVSDDDAIAKSADIVATINAGEIAEANFVLSTSNDNDVRVLAAELVADHQTNSADLKALMTQLGITPATSAVSSALRGEAQTGLSQLMSDTPAALDLDYVEMQLAMHQEAFDIIGILHDDVQASDDMRTFLFNTRQVIVDHRQHARDVLHGMVDHT